MPTRNSPRVKQFPKRRQDLADFDAMPRWMKETLWDFSFNCSLFGWRKMTPLRFAELAASARERFALSTEEYYGKDHPESATSLRGQRPGNRVSSVELGF